MIVCVGDKFKFGSVAEVVSSQADGEIIYIPEDTDITRQETDILKAAAGADWIFYDVHQYYNDSWEIVKAIKQIYRANKVRAVLLVQTTNPKSEIVKCAVSQQLKNLVNMSVSMTDQKEQIKKIMLDFYEANPREDIVEIEEAVRDNDKTLNEFVEELYDAKEREIKKEKTVIVHKKRCSEIVIGTVKGILKTVFSVISIGLMAVAVITLIYTEPREALFSTLIRIYQEVLSMVC